MILPKKAPSEDIVIPFDFSSSLEVGDTIGSIVSVGVSCCVGADADANAVMNGEAQVSTDFLSVYVPVTGGLMDRHYLFEVVILDSTNERRTLYAQLPIGIVP